MTKYELILVDMDDTLLDTHHSERASLRTVLNDVGIPAGEEMVNTYFQFSHEHWDAFHRGEGDRVFRRHEPMQRLLEHYGLHGYDALEVAGRYQEYMLTHIPPYPETEMFLERLAAAPVTCALATNGSGEMQRVKIAHSLVGRYFPEEVRFISQEVGFEKPSPHFFEAIFRRFPDVPRERILMIGDSLRFDIKGGNNAGIDTVWLNLLGKPCQPDVFPTYEARTHEQALNFILAEEEDVDEAI